MEIAPEAANNKEVQREEPPFSKDYILNIKVFAADKINRLWESSNEPDGISVKNKCKDNGRKVK